MDGDGVLGASSLGSSVIFATVFLTLRVWIVLLLGFFSVVSSWLRRTCSFFEVAEGDQDVLLVQLASPSFVLISQGPIDLLGELDLFWGASFGP